MNNFISSLHSSRPDIQRAPLSFFAAVSCAVIGAHFLERLRHSREAWEQNAYLLLVCFMGVLTVAEALEVLESAGFAEYVRA